MKLLFRAVIIATLLGLASTYSFGQSGPLKAGRSDTVMNILKHYKGERVQLILDSGKVLTGTVALVAAPWLQLSNLQDRAFVGADAVVRVSDIAAVLARKPR